jgi:hypothetical protein
MRCCYFCHAELDDKLQVMRSSVCSSCGKDLKVCRNCRFYSPGSHWDCAETVDELVTDKEKANFCAYFVFRECKPEGDKKIKDREEAKKAFKNLFSDDEQT